MKLLVVDDEPVVASLLRDTLVADGYEVVVAADGPTALEAVRAEVPDVVLLDVMMPGMSGFDVCRQLRATATTADVSIYLVTALHDREARLQGFEAGADDFISKPFDRSELRLRLRTEGRLKRFRRLLQQRNQLAELAAITSDGIVSLDADGAVLSVNPAAAALLDGARQAVSFVDIFEGRNRRLVAAMWRRLAVGGQTRAEARLSKVSGGRTITLSLELRRVNGDQGGTFAVAAVRDLSEQARSLERLERAERLALVGQASSGVTHDLVGCMVGVRNALLSIAATAPPDGGRARDVREAIVAVEEACGLAAMLTSFGRQPTHRSRECDVNAQIRAMAALLRSVAGAVSLDLDLAPEPLTVRADPTNIGRIVLNLVANAVNASDERGRVTVRTRIESDPTRPASSRSKLCVIQVIDTGRGISADLAENMFEPFVTTRDSSLNAGLGLPTVLGMVTADRGSISVEPNPVGGTIVSVTFRRLSTRRGLPKETVQ